jgi:hypothetical protein
MHGIADSEGMSYDKSSADVIMPIQQENAAMATIETAQ